MTSPIIVADYDPSWPESFATIRQLLESVLLGVPVVSIEHVGSTSVPGLAAKPIIDIDVIVERSNVNKAIAALEAAGYDPLGDLGVAERYAFKAPPGAIHQNTYVIVDGSLSLRNHLGLRDVLRADDALRDEYAGVKRRLADETDDIEVYVDGKTEVLLRILGQAGISAEELDAIEGVNRR